MTCKTAVLLMFATPAVCLANKPAPFAGPCALLDRILAITGSHSQTSAVALELVELVAEGQTGLIRPGTEAQAGMPPGELQKKEFSDSSVRACAFRKIGETGLPEALEFLRNLKSEDLGTDSSQQVWPAAQVALRNALLDRIADLKSKTEFLQKTITEPHDAVSNSALHHWAVDQLCDRGISTALPLIRHSIRDRLSGPSGEDEIAFCESRIQVVSRDPDRAKALGSVLTLDSGAASDRLMWWAVQQLDSMHSTGAEAELDRFANDIGKLREGSPQYARFWGFKQEIHDMRTVRSK